MAQTSSPMRQAIRAALGVHLSHLKAKVCIQHQKANITRLTMPYRCGNFYKRYSREILMKVSAVSVFICPRVYDSKPSVRRPRDRCQSKAIGQRDILNRRFESDGVALGDLTALLNSTLLTAPYRRINPERRSRNNGTLIKTLLLLEQAVARSVSMNLEI